MTIKTQVVKLKVNKTMQKHLDALCDYRRYCWNKGLETWQLMYEAHTLNKKIIPVPTNAESATNQSQIKLIGNMICQLDAYNQRLKTQLMHGRTSLIRLNLIGECLVLNQRKLPDKALKLIVPRLLMASFALIAQEAFQKKIGLI